jgi:hypothetical protein
MEEAETAAPRKREEWEIREDYQAIRRAIEVMRDPERLKDVQDHIKSKKDVEKIVDAAADGDLQKALGLME